MSSYSFFTVTQRGTDFKNHQLGSNQGTVDGYPFLALSPNGGFYAPMLLTNTEYAIVRIAFDGAITVLHTFAPSEGVPDHYSGIALSPEGDFYGSNEIYTNGVPSAYLYKLSPTGTFTKLVYSA